MLFGQIGGLESSFCNTSMGDPGRTAPVWNPDQLLIEELPLFLFLFLLSGSGDGR